MQTSEVSITKRKQLVWLATDKGLAWGFGSVRLLSFYKLSCDWRARRLIRQFCPGLLLLGDLPIGLRRQRVAQRVGCIISSPHFPPYHPIR
jgi:hypothetical protein